MKITIKNNLPPGKNIKIKESNAGIFRFLTTLAPGSEHPLRHDPHATYREYFLIMLPDKTQLRVLTSDDFNDFKEISIYEADGVYDWRGVPRNAAPGRGIVVNPAAPPVRDVPPVNMVTTETSQTGQKRGKVAQFFHKVRGKVA